MNMSSVSCNQQVISVILYISFFCCCFLLGVMTRKERTCFRKVVMAVSTYHVINHCCCKIHLWCVYVNLWIGKYLVWKLECLTWWYVKKCMIEVDANFVIILEFVDKFFPWNNEWFHLKFIKIQPVGSSNQCQMHQGSRIRIKHQG